jgi:beta-glucosidase
MGVNIENFLKEMTLEEKVSMVAGADDWHTAAIERLGIPSIGMTDGPNGAKGGYLRNEMTCACFPSGISMGAAWDTDLMDEIGKALAEETISKGYDILLGPCINIVRSPLGGRNFETFSEDPYLTGRLAVAYINGVQSMNVGVSLKHFACNNSEFERMTISSEVSERALREIYLPAFEAAVKEAQPWTVMSSYNRINGVYASDNTYLLTDILKGEWGFKGFVVSDWYGTNGSVSAAKGGLDLEMPGPPRFFGTPLLEAVQKGKVDETVIDDKVRRILRIIEKSGAFEKPKKPLGKPLQKPEHKELIRRAAAEGIVLLKNERDILPLLKETANAIAVIGPNADATSIQGGGSSMTEPDYAVTSLEGIIDKCGPSIEIAYEKGCRLGRRLAPVDPRNLVPSSGEGESGVTVEYFNNPDFSGDPVLTKNMRRLEFGFSPGFEKKVDANFSARFTGKFTAPKTGEYLFGLAATGKSRLFFDDKLLVDSWSDQKEEAGLGVLPSNETIESIEMREGQVYDIRVEFGTGSSSLGSLVAGCELPVEGDPIENAVTAASGADAAIVVVGTNYRFETEFYDRPSMELPGKQAELIERVASANENTVVVIVAGSPVAMDSWIDSVPGVIQAWFPGQESGNAIADVLFGDVNPCGKLPETLPRRLEDNPAYINYPGESGKVHYGEGIFVGYRYYDIKKVEPLFSFGHGLSYTTFEYSNLAIETPEIELDKELELTVDIKNTGARPGKEVVQLYLQDIEASLARPVKELKGFKKVSLEPGETRTIAFSLRARDLSFYDPLKKEWVAEGGEFKVLVGSSSRDIRCEGSFELLSGADDALRTDSRLSVGSKLKEILGDDQGYAALEKYFGEMIHSPQLELAMELTLQEIAKFVPDRLTPEVLRMINDDLAQID